MTMPVHNGETYNRDEILSRCLRAIESGQATIDACVQQFPEFKELGDLLRMAAAIRAMPRPQMSAAFTQRTQQHLQVQLRAQLRTQAGRRASGPRWVLRRLWLAVGLVAILLTLSGVGLVRASDNAVPGDALYGLKRGVEQAELLFANADARPGVLLHIAQRRIDEIPALVARKVAIQEATLNEMADSVNVAIVAQSDPAQRKQLAAKAAFVLRQAENSGLITADLADRAVARLAVLPSDTTPTPVAPSPTTAAVVQSLATLTGTSTVTPSPTLTPTDTPTSAPPQPATATGTVAGEKVITATTAPTSVPTITLTSTASRTAAPTRTPTSTASRTPTATPTPWSTLPPASPQLLTTAQLFTNVPASATPTLTQTSRRATVTQEATSAATAAATEAATQEATSAETPSAATEAATQAPTAAPTEPATLTATLKPSLTPTRRRPTRTPTRTPTQTPTATPTPTATEVPTSTPTPVPTQPASPFMQPPQIGTFNNCPPEGQGGDPALNRLRNRTDEGQYQSMTLDNLLGLTWPKDIEHKSHDQWPPGAQHDVAQMEGLPVVVEATLAQAQQLGQDASNCNSGSDVNIQLSLVANPGGKGDLGKAFVAVVTPRVRANHGGWTLDRLKALADAGARLRVSGWLVLDPDRPDDVGKTRGTLWEIHPITQIAVQKDGQWINLDDFQP
jgi:hypothetical protein